MTRCPACDRDSSCSWRCEYCGRDLVDVDDDEDPDAALVTDGDSDHGPGSGGGMERVTYREVPGILERIDAAVERGEYPNRSEAIRAATRALVMDTDSELVADGGRATATNRDPRPQDRQRAGPERGDRRRDGVRERGGVGDQRLKCQHTPPGDAPCAECLFDGDGGEG